MTLNYLLDILNIVDARDIFLDPPPPTHSIRLLI